jgi:Polyketide cyclase / dehydrase and lipid transport
MASVRRETHVNKRIDTVWDALRDVGALHTRLAPGFVIDTQLNGNVRSITFGNGMKADETIITVDDAARRVVYAAAIGQLTHHMASAQLFEEPNGCRFVWQADFLPDSAAATIGPMMAAGMAAMKRALEA